MIGPVGAIYNGLEILDEDDDEEAKNYALDVIRNVTEQASATAAVRALCLRRGGIGRRHDRSRHRRADFARLHRQGQTQPHWRTVPGHMGKDKVKLLLNLVASAVTALPRGGEIEVQMGGSLENPSFLIRCRGPNARPPQYLGEFITGDRLPALDAMTIQAYYTWRLAGTAGMRLEVLPDGADMLLSAKPQARNSGAANSRSALPSSVAGLAPAAPLLLWLVPANNKKSS